MKKLTAIALIAFASTGAWANADLAKKNNCLACHAVDKKIVGPAYQDVAKKYAGQADMPPQAQLSDADAKALAAWVLGGAK
jgi:cytochrome c